MVGKRLVNTGGAAGAAAFDALANFETVTYTGNGSTQKITGYIRKGAAFNGSSSNIDLGTDTFNTLTSYSFSCFVNLASSKNYNFLLDAFEYNGSTSRGFGIRINSSNNVQVVNYNNNTATTVTSSGTITNNTWTHIAVTNTQSNIVISIGGSEESPVSTSGFNFHSSTIYKLGAFQYTGNPVEYHLNGKLDQVRLFNTALNSTQIGELALEEYGDAENSVTDYFGDGSGVALYQLDEDANDTGIYPYGTGAIDSGQSAVFNGSSINTGLSLNGQTDYTISLWLNATGGSYFGGTTDSSGTNGFYFGYSTPTLSWTEVNAGSSVSYLQVTGQINDGSWNHIVFVRNGGTNYVYVNNGTPTSVSNGSFTHASNFILGKAGSVSSSGIIGKIDQVRIYLSALSASDVEALVSETNVPTANLVAHYKLDGNGNDETTNYNATSVNNVTYSDPAEFPLVKYNGTPTNVNFLGMAFQPDLVWIKLRNTVSNHDLIDSVRGATKVIESDNTGAEFTEATNLTSFDTNGFTVGSTARVNKLNEPIVAWCWKAADTTTTISAGTVGNTIASDVRANQDAGFSIVKYTGNDTTGATVGHGLSQPIELLILKSMDLIEGWPVYASAVITSDSQYLRLNETSAIISAGAGNYRFDVSAFNSSVFGLGSGNTEVNSSTSEYIAYCFHSVDGYQRIGTYTATGSAGSPRVYTTDDGTSSGSGGFQPRFLMVKNVDKNQEWIIVDSARNNGANSLQPNSSNAENTTGANEINFNLDGFTIAVSGSGVNYQAGDTFIYLAIA